MSRIVNYNGAKLLAEIFDVELNIRWPRGSAQEWGDEFLRIVNIIEEEEEEETDVEEVSEISEIEEEEEKTDAEFEEEEELKYYMKEVDGINNYSHQRVFSNAKNSIDIYKIIKKIEEEKDDIPYIILYFETELGIPRNTSIGSQYLDTLDDFLNRISEIERGEVTGSDAFKEEDNWNLITDVFDAHFVGIKGYGTSKNILFECLEIKSKYSCYKEVFENMNLEDNNWKNCINQNFDSIVDYIEGNKLSISIIANTFRLKKSFIKIYRDEKREKIEITVNKKRDKVIKLNNGDIDIVNLYGDYQKNKHVIIYDSQGKHYDLCIGEKPKFKDNIYISSSKKLYFKKKMKNGAFKYIKIATPTEIYKKSDVKFRGDKLIERLYVFFDFETVVDWSKKSVLIPYSLSYMIISESEIKKIKDYGDRCEFVLGFDCAKKMMDDVLSRQKDKIITFISFNGANFDNYVLYNECNKINPDLAKNPFYSRSQLLNFTISGRHDMFDLRKHLLGSLEGNCKGFGLPAQLSKKKFDHFQAQKLYDEENLIETYTKDIEELREYNNFDVISLAEIFRRYENTLINIKGFENINLIKFKTIGSLIYDRFQTHVKTNNIKMPKFYSKNENHYQYYRDMLNHKMAGRVELFNGVTYSKTRNSSLDQCSQYPYTMAVNKVYYPTGDIIEVDSFEEMPNDKIGFFYCDVNQESLAKKNLPNIICEKTKLKNNWQTKKELKNIFLSTAMIDCLMRYIPKKDIKIYNGIYFTSKIRSCDLFGFLLPLMNEKNKQDNYKKSEDVDDKSKYNPALRETLKLLMNSTSGKVIEAIHTNKIKEVNTYGFLKIKNSKSTKSINTINVRGNKIYCDYELYEKDLLSKHRPVYYGILIYDYSKIFMYDNLISKIGKDKLHYMDTDALKMGNETTNKWIENYGSKTIVPHWEDVEEYDERYKTHTLYNQNSKVFGSFEDEFSPDNNYNVYLAKKNYISLTIDENNLETKVHMSFKGVSKNAVILDSNSDLDEVFTTYYYRKSTLIYLKKNDKYYDKNLNLLYKNPDLEGLTEKIKFNSEKEAYYYLRTDNAVKNMIKNNYVKFFDKLYFDRTGYILTSSLHKSVGNLKRNVGIGETQDRYNKLMNNIVAKFNIKKINIKDE